MTPDLLHAERPTLQKEDRASLEPMAPDILPASARYDGLCVRVLNRACRQACTHDLLL